MDGGQFDNATKNLFGSRRAALVGSAALAAGGMVAARSTLTGSARKKKKKKKVQTPDRDPVAQAAFTCSGPADDEFTGAAVTRFAQSFTASRSGTLNQVTVAVRKNVSNGDYVVQLLKLADDVPSNSPLDILAAAVIPDAQVASGQTTLVAKFAATNLTQGTEYAVAVSRPGSTDLVVQVREGGNRCGGEMSVGQGTAEFVAFNDPALDMIVGVLVS